MARIKISELKMNPRQYTQKWWIRMVCHLVNNFLLAACKSKFTASIDWNSNYTAFETRLLNFPWLVVILEVSVSQENNLHFFFWMKEHGYKDILDGRIHRRIRYFETSIRPPRSRDKIEWHHRHAINMTRNGEEWMAGSSELCIRSPCHKISCNI